ncbi:MAG: putative acetyltransferase [Deltaproteobacteria bacterium]|nr:putative acetyltransferase [Deltaproteobacteria bacterium]
MHLRSLGLSTDLGLLATRGKIFDRGDYLVAITADDPGYYHGNLLVLRAAPQVGKVAYWMRRFSEELGTDPRIRHMTLRWDGTTGDVGARAELEAAGFRIEVAQVMTARELVAPASQVEIRPLAPDEMPAIARLGFALGDRHDESYRLFLQRRAAWKRQLVESGEARFWGAFDDGTLVGSLGLVPLGLVARYQDVQIATSHRRRGIASALLATAARAVKCEQLVIVAVPGSEAARVYERVGFQIVETTASACRYPRSR